MLNISKEKYAGKFHLFLHIHEKDSKVGALSIHDSGRQVFHTGEIAKPSADNMFKVLKTESHVRDFLSQAMKAGSSQPHGLLDAHRRF